MKRLTEKQAEVMRFLRSYTEEHGYPPTMREIGARFGFSWPAAKGHLKALARKGLIRLGANRSRAIEIRPHALGLPLAGTVRAGKPVLAVEEAGERIFVDRELFGHEDAFVLRVKGDSMQGAGILEGDYVVVRPQGSVRSGETAAVLIGDEATVKKVVIKKDQVTLVPENPSMDPVTYPAGEVSIIGRVTGVIRKL